LAKYSLDVGDEPRRTKHGEVIEVTECPGSG
jgi:hypothetical protein